MTDVRSTLIALGLGLLMANLPERSLASSLEPVDAMLVLAVDVSGSITTPSHEDDTDVDEYALQRRGIAEALRSSELAYILEKCNGGGVALTYMEWSGGRSRPATDQRLPWVKLRTKADLEAFARRIENLGPRELKDETDIVSALQGAEKLLEASPFVSARKLISLSGDGMHNVPGEGDTSNVPEGNESLASAVRRERDQLIKKGVTVNALVILSDSAKDDEAGLPHYSLTEYFNRNVVGGDGSFMMDVPDFQHYGEGLRKKLVRELNNCML